MEHGDGSDVEHGDGSDVPPGAGAPAPGDQGHRSALVVRLFRNPKGYLVRQWPLLLVGVCFAVGLALIALGYWRRGAMVCGGATGVAALFRLFLPPERAGLLVVRSRPFDAFVVGAAAAAMIALAILVPSGR